ncbi:MAG TPA: NUDIX domain-containing protein [Polyangiaceae bacterium]|nr:NUDIX domain-containing protein [Polyangiaceae bacterium]
MTQEEILPIVNETGVTTGAAPRSVLHSNPSLLHPVVHCLVTNRSGALLMQLRGRNKDVQPGRWDTSVGGHVCFGELVEAAVVREIGEELGIAVQSGQLEYLYRYVMRSAIESELVYTYRMVHEGPFRREPLEIDDLRFWSRQEIRDVLGAGVLTPNFEDEFRRYCQVFAD